ncbi:MAG: shikimate kinase [Alphaproteobacteria bacterium]|nr:shikimate kinase [Alphaproteobacteria bacterium]MCD8526435.1 shikimate kinase [Alphaproteobacteria bacterium]
MTDDKNMDDIEVINGALDRPIVLVGMMGAGKSHVGRELARVLSLDFVDSDTIIEDRAGCSISDIFARDGEAAFRQQEEAVINELLAAGPHVLSVGGGAITTPQVLDGIKSRAISVWVQASLEDMAERVARNNKRPLLQDSDPAVVLSGLLEKRRPLYAMTDIQVMNRNGQDADTIAAVIESLAKALKSP